MNEKQQIICQRNDPKYDISNVFEVNREDIRQVSNLLDQTSIQNKEVSLHVMAKVGNKRQMCALEAAHPMVSFKERWLYRNCWIF